MQTCVVACYSLSFSGGFGCYLLSMDSQTYNNLGPIAGNRSQVTPQARDLSFSSCMSSGIVAQRARSTKHVHPVPSAFEHCLGIRFGNLIAALSSRLSSRHAPV